MLAWMFYAAFVGGIVAAAALALERLAANTGRPRRTAWLAALTLAVLIPVTGGLRKPERPAAVAAGEAPEITETVPEARWTIVPVLPLPARHDPTRTAKVAWAAGSGVALGVFTVLLAAVFRARRRWPRARVDGTDVYVSHRFGPALVGVLRPDIVLPEWVLGLDPGARSAVIRHEVEHARARDHLALLYAGLVLAAFPWSPAIWWMCRRLRAAVEIDCDQRVIASGIGVAEYGALLLDAGSRSHARWGFAPAMGQPRSLLERRLKTMSEKQMKLKRSQIVFLSGAAVLALAIACDAPAPTQIEEAREGAVAEALAVESSGRDGGDSGIAGIIWEDPPVIWWDHVELYHFFWSQQHFTYRNETPVEFANKLLVLARRLHPVHRETVPDLRAETIEVAADRIRVDGNRLVLRGGIVKVSSAQEDDAPRDYVLLRVTGGSQQDGIWSGRLFLFNRLGIAVPSSESELIEDLDAL
ncbi:MAG: M56 family metallopeptidase [Gemmatimonadetes bacterium]|nr:M56 family metallopeptidase [Gemmatimonadota bacterium]MYH52583.1 M56 family metallopeptidase [Gemmatimonadota bacterium]MYK67610.1 M56 family metallopeptidase [Gemmatimonadota bacterium]